MKLDAPVSSVSLVGDVYAKRLEKLGIRTLEDLFHHYPSRYDDLSFVSSIFSAQPGETVTIQGTIQEISNKFTTYGKKIQQATVEDETGTIDAVWFNQPFILQSLKQGTRVSLSGTVKQFGRTRSLQSPEYEILKTNNNPYNHSPHTIHTARIVPIYPETYGISSKWLRSRIVFILQNYAELLEEWLPEDIVRSNSLMPFSDAIYHIHFPDSFRLQQQARHRLSFDELFLTQLASQMRKEQWHREHVGNMLQTANSKQQIETFINKLPFMLTRAQQRCVDEILADISRPVPMNRLLQGDVGSGKTVVAAVAMYAAFLNGYKSVIMAPTEILAQQHYKTLTELFKPYNISVGLITSSTKKTKQPNPAESGSKHSTIQPFNHSTITVGTHALLYKDPIDNLALVIIDEQHRFGVKQRTHLREMGIHPHLLSMTATPIPRSIALIIHSELDLSYIDEMPHGRKRVKTWLVPNEKREKAYEWIEKQIANSKQQIVNSNNSAIQPFSPASPAGRHLSSLNQAFIICPLIEQSDHESLQSVKAATTEFETLKTRVFPSLKLGLLHGKVKPAEKQRLLAEFASGMFDILVATPVVEVGIDIPNATVIVIEAAERFGLAQLHQLRGRVGRSDKQSYCLLFTGSDNEQAQKRLKHLETLYNGAELAEVDLSLRGPGELYGTQQHGYSSFKIARFSDHAIISSAQQAAKSFIEAKLSSEQYPNLHKRLQPYIIQSVNPD